MKNQKMMSFLKDAEFLPFIQPIFTHDNKLTGGEVLLRVNKDGHIHSPVSFIGALEKTDLMNSIVINLIQKVGKQFYCKKEQLPGDFYFSFNITASQLFEASVLNEVKKFCADFDGYATIVLEIVEREPLILDDEMLDVIEGLIAHGVRFAIDDFGSGTSSLKYLEHVGFSIIKLDKTLTVSNKDELVYKNVIKAMVALSHSLNIKLIAEGVETNCQQELLEQEGVDSMQGYHLAKPMGATDFINTFIAN
ncbi:EAL domain-containing protein [Cedecea neteri]|uniref:EAL domain-containing protein n=1 Tax=Cedecea neteri TaxID=158822 RepID=UPI002AA6E65C|nr:EAL domain-containing protein [Cedecea neteri]WPU21966.1 EAL domain-containing protein [Cedecea neteri]